MKLEPHQQRVVEETEQLRVRMQGLKQMLASDTYKGLTDMDEAADLLSQYDAMLVYWKILQRRVQRFLATEE